ncbi:MAG: hypothetical protein FWE27_05360 [Defluviitaleaceae bacterium]|nr:hypothetical protein [Defluviitaleaceae bacterium]
MDINYSSGYSPAISDATIKPQVQISASAVDAMYQTETPAEAATPQTAAPVEILTDTLLSYGYKVTEENKEMLRAMLENGIPLTKEGVGRMNQALKLTGSLEKALFMLQNNIRMTQANAAQLEGFVSGQTKITSQINNLLAAVEQLNDPALSTQLKQILAGKGIAAESPQTTVATTPTIEGATQTSQSPHTPQIPTATQTIAAETIAPSLSSPQNKVAITNPFATGTQIEQASQAPTDSLQQAAKMQMAPQTSALEPQPASPREDASIAAQPRNDIGVQTQPAYQSQSLATPENLLFKLAESTPQTIDRYLNNLREVLSEIQTALADRQTPGTARVLQEVRTLETQIDFSSQIRNQIFVQLPLLHNGEQTQTTLHVYKDAKKSSANSSDSVSALIALDTAALGHFETYVQKNSRGINCQFRLESDEIVKAVRNNIHKLSALLNQSGYSLESFSFLPPGEPYTLLDNPKSITNPTTSPSEISHFDERV